MQSNLSLDISLLTNNYIPAHPFNSAQDIVERLVPFHVWQVHEEEVDCGVKGRERRMQGESRVERHCVVNGVGHADENVGWGRGGRGGEDY